VSRGCQPRWHVAPHHDLEAAAEIARPRFGETRQRLPAERHRQPNPNEEEEERRGQPIDRSIHQREVWLTTAAWMPRHLIA
jgi:hypothetical protein